MMEWQPLRKNFSKQLKALGYIIDREAGTGQKIVYLEQNYSQI